METSQAIQLTPTAKTSRHGEYKNSNYHREYYLKNREKLLTYSHDYYGVKKTLTSRFQGEKFGVKKFFSSHTRNNNISSQETKNLFFFGEEGSKREKLERRLDKERLRLATKDKRPLKKYWNQPWFKEWLDKKGLLKRYQEWSLRGGNKLGKKYLSFLDVDIEKPDLEEWRKKQVRKNVLLFLNYLNCFYVETKKGFHVYILSDELLTNEVLYHVDSWLKRSKIVGSIQSKGKYVVGFDSIDKKLVEKGKWFWHVKNLEEVKEKLAKFFLLVGSQEEKATKTVKKTYQKKIIPQFKFSTQVKILSTHEKFINRLGEMMRKVRYLSSMGKNGYFLLNSYQKPRILEQLPRGKILSLGLIQGSKHAFFGRINI
ncbi:hypothetical protein [endosymbiont GvMRE of Glomus versiforme]|uniref:hypothetical protein n=1 Tax=endosymbiont GvMRE of Glomus versiforme TaxID=2039283 RepID=UPI000EC0A6DC|nr:hypothetical protein [endosymbiont GvMRE of Glomus versiforme]RHZ35911.1 hypothetical protein GvMRE_Ic4g76 [endosymbiont GvMRE of Glomus versiforme]